MTIVFGREPAPLAEEQVDDVVTRIADYVQTKPTASDGG